jgi:hypothetical protein
MMSRFVNCATPYGISVSHGYIKAHPANLFHFNAQNPGIIAEII